MNYDENNRKDEKGPVKYDRIYPRTPESGSVQRQTETGTGQRYMWQTGTGQRALGSMQTGQPGFPGFGPGQARPGNQPPLAPPDFTPQLPREEQQLLSGPSDFRGPFGGRIIDFRRRPQDFRRCLNRFTYIWLVNGSNFWFYPVFIGRNHIEGFRWRRNRWDYDRININRILFHLCF